MTELYQVIGQISYSYSRIDFLISNIAFDFGLAENPYIYFAKTKFEKKIESLKQGILNQIHDKDLVTEFSEWTDKLQELREKRNNILHSIILTNSQNNEDHVFYNYRFDKSSNFVRDINRYSMGDLRTLNQDFIKTHNDGFLLWDKLKTKLGAAGSL